MAGQPWAVVPREGDLDCVHDLPKGEVGGHGDSLHDGSNL